MSDIDQTKLRKIDLTLLLVFLGLMRHRKAALVAGEPGLTPSSISHSLRRLREIFEDPLFLRRAHGLEPTAVADALEPKIRQIVETLDQTLAAPDGFEPEKSGRVIRIAGMKRTRFTPGCSTFSRSARKSTGRPLRSARSPHRRDQGDDRTGSPARRIHNASRTRRHGAPRTFRSGHKVSNDSRATKSHPAEREIVVTGFMNGA